MTEHAKTHAPAPGRPPAAEPQPPLDIRERGGAVDGQPQLTDRRLFVQFLAFTGEAQAASLGAALAATGVDCVLYEEVNDPRGFGVAAMTERADELTTKLRPALSEKAFANLTLKPQFSMLGRTYALGYEPKLEDWLLERPRRVTLDPACPWAVWYPLRRTGAFSKLSHQEQGQILKEHGIIGRRFGDAGHAQDVRLACHGLDVNDNDFVIGLIGKELAPLSILVQQMRGTQQTSTYIEKLGPFFVGKAVWRSRELK